MKTTVSAIVLMSGICGVTFDIVSQTVDKCDMSLFCADFGLNKPHFHYDYIITKSMVLYKSGSIMLK